MAKAFFLRSGQSGPVFDGNPGDLLALDADGKASFQAPPAAGVSSVFGRTGAVVAAVGDYAIQQIGAGGGTNGMVATLVAGVWQPQAVAPGGVTSVFGRTGAVVAVLGDYTSSLVSNASAVAGATVSAALNTLGSVIAGLTIATTAPLAGGGLVASGLTLSVADVSSTSKGVAPAITGGNLALLSNGGGTSSSWAQVPLATLAQSGAAVNQYPSWSGSAWVPTTPLTSPANPGDNGKVPIVSAGDFTYGFIANAQVSTTAAIATSKLAVGTAGQALITTAGVAAWGSDFGATELLTTGSFRVNNAAGFLQIGTNTAGATRAATAGTFRTAYGFDLQTRNLADAANKSILSYGVVSADLLALGNGVLNLTLGSNTTATSLASSVAFTLTTNGGGTAYQFSNTAAFWPAGGILRGNSGFTIDSLVLASAGGSGARTSILAQSVTGGGASFGGPIQLVPGTATQNGNIEFFGTSGVAKDNGMAGGMVQKDASAAPTAGVAGAMFHYSAAGGLPTWVTAANNFFQITAVGTNAANVGGAVLPATPVGFVGCQAMVGGVLQACKIPLYNP